MYELKTLKLWGVKVADAVGGEVADWERKWVG